MSFCNQHADLFAVTWETVLIIESGLFPTWENVNKSLWENVGNLKVRNSLSLVGRAKILPPPVELF